MYLYSAKMMMEIVLFLFFECDDTLLFPAESRGFMSNIRFFEDLYVVSEAVAKSSDRLYILKQKLREINRNLPAAVYVPFTQGN